VRCSWWIRELRPVFPAYHDLFQFSSGEFSVAFLAKTLIFSDFFTLPPSDFSPLKKSCFCCDRIRTCGKKQLASSGLRRKAVPMIAVFIR
jgi:hypothetical protein